MIRELVADGTTVLLTTQYLEEADRLANRIAVIDGGRVIAEGTSAELKAGLGATVVEVGFPDSTTTERAVAVLAGADGLAPERDGDMLRLSGDDGTRTLMAVLRALDAEGMSPTRLALREPSLDDVFLASTGTRRSRQSRPSPLAPAPAQEPAPASPPAVRHERDRPPRPFRR